MAAKKIRIGIAGLREGDGWAYRAHLPALRALDVYELVGVANSSLTSSQKAASALNIPKAFGSVAEMAADPDIDMVSVTVKVPHHLELATPALEAGKMVYCEWPLGNGLREAEMMAAAAKSRNVRTLVGHQAWSSPVVRLLKDLLADGYVGEVLSTTLVGSAGQWGSQVDSRDAYLNDRKNGADVLAVPFGHTIDALCHCLGEFSSLNATLVTRRQSFKVSDTGQTLPMQIDDQVVVSGQLNSGAVVSAHYRGGQARGTNLLWEINGTEGDLQVTAGSGHVQIVPLTLKGARGEDRELKPIETPAKYRLGPSELSGGAINVAEAYIQFAQDSAAAFPLPDFEHAVQRHRLLDAIQSAASSGCKFNF